jgi:hypothetical protein
MLLDTHIKTSTKGSWATLLATIPARLPVGNFLNSCRQWDQWQRTACCVWVIILTAITVRGWISPAHSVYPVYVRAARDWLGGSDLYLDRGSPYRYSPLVAVLFVPLGLLSDASGGTLWRLLNYATYLAGLAWFTHAVLQDSCTCRQRGLLFLLIIPLSLGSLNNAQSNALVLGLLLCALAAAARERFHLSGASIALACLFKVYPIALGLLLLLHFRRRLAFPLILWLLLGLALPFAFGEPHFVARQYSGWLHHLRTDDRQGLPLELWYRDLRLLCKMCHIPLSGYTYPALQLVVALAIAVVCWRSSRTGTEDRKVLVTILAWGTCWMTLFGSATESCTYILLAPSLGLALLSSWCGKAPWPRRWVLTASFTLFTFTQAAVWFPNGKALHALGLQPLAALLFFLALLASLLPGQAAAGPEELHAPGLTAHAA